MKSNLTREEFIAENKRITDGIQELILLNNYKAGPCVCSMLTLCIQQHRIQGLTKEKFLQTVENTWKFIEEFEKDQQKT